MLTPDVGNPDDVRKAVKSLHARRRAAGLCIYDPRETKISAASRPPHGPPYRGGRCFECWQKKLESAARRKTNPRAARRRSRTR